MTVFPVLFGLGAFGVWYARWVRKTAETHKGATAMRVAFGVAVSLLGAMVLVWDLYTLPVALEIGGIVLMCLAIPGFFMFLGDYYQDKELRNGWFD